MDGAAYSVEALYIFSVLHAPRYLKDLLLPHSVNEDVRFGVEEYRAPDLIRPVVVMREPPQAGLYPADDYRHVREGRPDLIRVDYSRPVGATALLSSRRIVVLASELMAGRVIGDPKAVAAWKAGRDLYGRYRQLYGADKAAGSAEKRAGKTVENWIKSDAVTGDEVIRQAVRNKALVQRVVDIHGENSPAHVALNKKVRE